MLVDELVVSIAVMNILIVMIYTTPKVNLHIIGGGNNYAALI